MSAELQLLHDYAVTRDAEAFSALLRQHQNLVYGTCLRILGNPADAEDAAQECFLKLARHAATIQTSVIGWLHSCATRVSLNVLQQRQSRTRRENRYTQTRAAESVEPTWREISPLVDQALERLSPEVRYVVIERFLEQRSQTAIAEELGLSRGVVRRRLATGIEMIRRSLKKAGVLASVTALTGLLADNAAVAAPAALGHELGKLALFGSGLPPAPPTFGGASFGHGSATTTAVLAKKAAGTIAAAVFLVGFGLGVAWLCGVGAPRARSGEEGPWPFPQGEGGAAEVSPGRPGAGGAWAGPGRDNGRASDGPRGGSRIVQPASGAGGRRSGRAPAGSRGVEGGASAPGVLAAAKPVEGPVASDEEETEKRKRVGAGPRADRPAGRNAGSGGAVRRRPGVLYSIFGPSTPNGGSGEKEP